jgi:hypothetical protein
MKTEKNKNGDIVITINKEDIVASLNKLVLTTVHSHLDSTESELALAGINIDDIVKKSVTPAKIKSATDSILAASAFDLMYGGTGPKPPRKIISETAFNAARKKIEIFHYLFEDSAIDIDDISTYGITFSDDGVRAKAIEVLKNNGISLFELSNESNMEDDEYDEDDEWI